MSSSAMTAAVVILLVPILLVLVIAVGVWRDADHRRARSQGHRRQFAAFLAKVQSMDPPDAVLAFERHRATTNHRFSKDLAWPTLEELFPGLAAGQLEKLRQRTRQLDDAAMRQAGENLRQWARELDRAALRRAKKQSKDESVAALQVMYPEFSPESVRESLEHAHWDAQF